MEALPLIHFILPIKCCKLYLLLMVSVACFSSDCGACGHEPFNCSGRLFENPFGGRNSGCGNPLLQLECKSSTPLLDINGSQYYILDYSFSFNNSSLKSIEMTIVDMHLKDCNQSSSNSTVHFWSSDQLSIVDGYKIITLWEGCGDDNPDFVHEVFPLECGAGFSYGTSLNMSWTGKCRSHVMLPVRADLTPEPNLKQIIDDGFKIKWIPSSSCKQCTSDKGICAYHPNITSDSFFCILKAQGKYKVGAIAGVVAGIAILLIVAVLLLVAFRKRASSSVSKVDKIACSPASKVEKFLQDFTHEMPTRYSYSHLKKITNNFAEKLGEGGFGVVYKGKLSKGNLVAVKILDQSRRSESQFMNEVATIGRIHHLHLVRLMGYCFEHFRSALVYEYMANGSLEKFVFEKKEKRQILSWEQLYSIALGAARGITYLHEECERRIILFNIMPHNMLLDADFTPKVSDFGLAKLCGRLEDHLSMMAARGTPGYVAPELWTRNLGPISDKADVYSFGMMLLEIVGGRKNIDVRLSRPSEIYFPEWAFKLLEKGELEEELEGK